MFINMDSAAATAAPAADDAGGLQEIVVTAQRREESAQNIGIAMSVLPGQSLADKTINVVNDLQNAVPSLQVEPAFGSGQPQFRLRGVGFIESCQAVALDCFPAFGAEAFMFPDAWKPESWQLRTGNQDPISVVAEQSLGRLEFQQLGWRKLKSRSNQMLARYILKEMSTRENILDAPGKLWVAHPIILNLAQAFRSDCTGAEILPVVLARWLVLDQVIDQRVERPVREV